MIAWSAAAVYEPLEMIYIFYMLNPDYLQIVFIWNLKPHHFSICCTLYNSNYNDVQDTQGNRDEMSNILVEICCYVCNKSPRRIGMTGV